jgi:hypothetical protein
MHIHQCVDDELLVLLGKLSVNKIFIKMHIHHCTLSCKAISVESSAHIMTHLNLYLLIAYCSLMTAISLLLTDEIHGWLLDRS